MKPFHRLGLVIDRDELRKAIVERVNKTRREGKQFISERAVLELVIRCVKIEEVPIHL